MNLTDSAPTMPPCSIEAEQAILGAILLDNVAMPKAMEVLVEEDFYRTAHQKIYRAMLDLNDTGVAIDNITLTERLSAQGALESVGGATYLAELLQIVSGAANIRFHCEQVRELAQRRTLRRHLTEVLLSIERGHSLEMIAGHLDAIPRFPNGPDAKPIQVNGSGGSFQVGFPAQSILFRFDRLAENARGVHAELSVECGKRELLTGTDLNLKAESSRLTLSKSLTQHRKCIQWKSLLDQACAAILRRFRDGEPIAELMPADSTHTPSILNPVVYRNHQTLIFAPGGSYKSYLSLYFALVAIAGRRENGLTALETKVLYLDWELDAGTVGSRLKALHNGHSELSKVRPFYRHCIQPLHLDAPQIATEVSRLGVGLVIVDSAAMACGGDLNSPESAIKLQQALRRIGCASIVLAHVSKSTAEGQDKSAYGTVFFRELARNVWELSRPENSNRVVLSQTGAACKNSFGRKQDPLGFEFSFESDRVKIASFNPADEEESGFEDKLPTRQRIVRLLSDQIARTSQEIATELRLPLTSIKTELSHGRGKYFDRTGPYREGRWVLIAPQNAQNPSLRPIVEASIVDSSLRSLRTHSENGANPAVLQEKPIVEGIVDDRQSLSLIEKGGTISTPVSTINQSTIEEEVSL